MPNFRSIPDLFGIGRMPCIPRAYLFIFFILIIVTSISGAAGDEQKALFLKIRKHA